METKYRCRENEKKRKKRMTDDRLRKTEDQEN